MGWLVRKIRLSLLAILWVPGITLAQAPDDLTTLSVEELMRVEMTVTSVSKRAEKISDAAAAVYVLTQDDIRRSGATSIPEALRWVPGLQVARIDSNKWAITARGFNTGFANKLLVMIDGRTVYTPLFSGVWWDTQDTLMEDIDRIEVIRGPGATLWGANAVNGVINIITKPSKDTQDGLFSLTAGDENRVIAGARYGGKLGAATHYRAYAKYLNRDGAPIPDTDRYGQDDWWAARGGFRIDSVLSGRDTLTIQGDGYRGDSGARSTPFPVPTNRPPFSRIVNGLQETNGFNVLGRWKHSFSPTSEFMLQTYYDRAERIGPDVDNFRNTIDTFDLDLQHSFNLGWGQQIVWGGGYRQVHNDVFNVSFIGLTQPTRNISLFTFFVQDDITLIPNRLSLTLGSKFEHNDFTGFEVQPNGRLLFKPNDWNSAWLAVSRAVRTPSLFEDNGRTEIFVLPGGRRGNLFIPPAFGVLNGSARVLAEELMAYEIGYRVQPAHTFSLDFAAFYNVYDRIVTQEPGACSLNLAGLIPQLDCPVNTSNLARGESHGVEAVADWRPQEWWKLRAGYTYFKLDLHSKGDSRDAQLAVIEGRSPRHQFFFQSFLDLPRHFKLDLNLRYVDELPSVQIGSYVTLDARLAWQPRKDFELSFIGQNLVGRHQEFNSAQDFPPTEVERSLMGVVRWRF